MIGRFILLHTMALGILLAVYFYGDAAVFVQADHVYALPIMLGLALVGSILIGMKRDADAEWLAERLPTIGLILTVFGILLIRYRIPDALNDSTRIIVFRDIIGSTIGTFLGMGGLLWVNFVARVCR